MTRRNGEKKTMRVAAHGNVDVYCRSHGFEIVERYDGDLEEYQGGCSVLVTDNCADEKEYYRLKYKLLRRRIELLSTHWYNADLSGFIQYMHEMDRKNTKSKGRAAFGYRYVNGEEVVDPVAFGVAQRIVALRDAGKTYREIVADDSVRYPDGRRMSISTVQVILKNRSKYE